MTKPVKKTVLFANGFFPRPESVASQISDADYLIAVDGGLNYITQLGLKPDLIIGDLDSIEKEKIDKFRSEGVNIQQHPIDKDQTDLQLALEAAQELDSKVIWIIAALGGRLDQSLGNIFLLTQPSLAEYDVRLKDGQQEVFLIRSRAYISGKPGDRVSLLPLYDPARGITTQGLKYSLENETLFPDQTRGISNMMISSLAMISINQGLLLCIHEFSDQNTRSI